MPGATACHMLVLAAVLFVAGCAPRMETSPSEYPPHFSDKQLDVSAAVDIFHATPDSSEFVIALNTDNLLYTKINSETFSASARVTITPQSAEGIDEAGMGKIITMTDDDDSKRGKRIMGRTTAYLESGKSYVIRFDIMDAHTGKQTRLYRHTDKSAPGSRDYFSVRRLDSDIPIFTDRISPSGDYLIRVAPPHGGKLFVSYYDREFPLPPPPFSRYDPEPFEYRPDSQFELGLGADNTTQFQGVHTGFYHFRTDTNNRTGLSLFTSGERFPKVTTDQDLLGPFRYLLSGKEYEAMMKASNPKAAMENHWLQWAGSKERARRNLTAYFERVEEANRHFSSHVEGWKSDRGLIYIIFGKPNKAYRNGDVETWIYGEENNPLSITFYFVKVINPFTDNDFRLERNERYKPAWYRAIDTWRNGRIF